MNNTPTPEQRELLNELLRQMHEDGDIEIVGVTDAGEPIYQGAQS